MTRINRKLLFFAILLLILGGCGKSAEQPKVSDEPNTNTEVNDKDTEKENVFTPLQEKVANMSIDEKIGQVLMIGVEGETFSEEMNHFIQNEQVGGVILFKKNMASVNQSLELINALKKANEVNDIPLFISVDEEGGSISRMPKEINSLPTTREIGNRNDPDFSNRVGKFLSSELHEFGFNMNFAPVLDVDSNPNNPVIGDRSFSSDPDIVSELGIATMKGMQENGIIPVVKHFPGHGDTSVDSHSSLPILTADMERLKSVELVPFQAAIDEGADVVMTAHIIFTRIDSSNPATLSKAVVTDLLREEMGFNGVIITDDLTMGAITTSYSAGQAAVKAFLAGNDILLICHEYDNYTMAIHAMKEAVASKKISMERLDESVERILKLKEKYNIEDKQMDFVDVDKINLELNDLLK